jgi:hypothetical protein
MALQFSDPSIEGGSEMPAPSIAVGAITEISDRRRWKGVL